MTRSLKICVFSFAVLTAGVTSAQVPGLKLELDKGSGALLVDRFMATPMHYPCNYGFVPHTLSLDRMRCATAHADARHDSLPHTLHIRCLIRYPIRYV